MKKALFLFIVVAASSQLKAQTLPLRPFDTLKSQPKTFYKKYFFNPAIPDSLRTLDKNGYLWNDKKTLEKQYVYNDKSVYKVPGYSMPIKKLDINSKMPVVKPSDYPVSK